MLDHPPSDDARLTDSAKGTARGSATNSSTDASPAQAEQARAALRALVAEMRSIAMVAGQCSVEGPEGVASSMAAAEAERAARWADQLDAVLRPEGDPNGQ